MTFDPRAIGALPTAQAGQMAPLPTSRYILPQYEERTAYGMKRQDPYTKLFEDRIIFLGVQVDDASADDVMAQLLVLESQDPDRDITLYINSPGGSFTALTAIYDTMQYVKPEGHDRVPRSGGFGRRGAAGGGSSGQAARAAQRPHHDPPAGDGRPGRRPGLRPRDPGQRDHAHAERLEETLAFHSGRTKEQVSTDIERDKILTAKSALDYGLVDQVCRVTQGAPGAAPQVIARCPGPAPRLGLHEGMTVGP